MIRNKRIVFLVCLALATVIVASCGKSTTTTPSQSSAPATKTSQPATTSASATATTTKPATSVAPTAPSGELRMAVVSFASEPIDPIKADAQGQNTFYSTKIFDSLFTMVAGKIVGHVVEKWETAPDGLSWVYSIRKGIKFHDGTELTAKDVKFSIERYMSAAALSANIRNAVDRVDLVDTYTVRVYTKGKQPFLPSYQVPGIAPGQGMVMPMDYIGKNGLEYFLKNPMGSGPWRLTKYTAGDSYQMTANESYWGKVPAFKTLTVMVVPEATTRVAMLKGGNVDVTDVSLEDALALEKAGYLTYPMMATQLRLQFFGTLDPRGKNMPTGDVRVRQALEISVNQDEIARTLFYGKSLPLMPPRALYGVEGIDTDFWMKKTKEYYQFDQAKAKKLLADAGYSGGVSGIKIYVVPQPGLGYMDNLAAIVQSQWKAIGVNAEIAPMEMATYLTDRTEPADRIVGHAVFTTLSTLTPIIGALEGIYGSKGISQSTTRRTKESTTNYTPELDKLIYEAVGEMDPAKRDAMTAQVIQMGMDLHVNFAFPQLPVFLAVGPKVKFDLKQPVENNYFAGWANLAQHK